ncbi:MAG: hypothetical protein V1792_17595 [Pseudomonadota bacterium]
MPRPCPHADLWVSRLAVAKGCLRKDPEYVARIMAREFKRFNLKHMISSLLPKKADGSRVDIGGELIDQELVSAMASADLFLRVYRGDWPLSQKLRDYFEMQDSLLSRLVAASVCGHSDVILVDTGWTGNTQAMLMRRFNELRWIGLYFGRWDYRDVKPHHLSQVAGLICDDSVARLKDPEAAIFDFHHLIEGLLEINCGTVEGYHVDGVSGEIVLDGGSECGYSLEPMEHEDLFGGVVEFFCRASRSWSEREITAKATEALYTLSKKIRYPKPEDLRIIAVPSRSIDFGRKGSNPVLRDAVKRPSLVNRLKNIDSALWKQGQMTVDFPRIYPFLQLLYNTLRSSRGGRALVKALSRVVVH